MNALSIAWKDLQILVRDRGTIVYLFVMPLVFIVMMAGLFSSSQSQASQQLALPVVNLDPDGAMSQMLVTNLSQAGGLQVTEYGQAEAESLLADKQIPRVLTIPEGFTAAAEARRLASSVRRSLRSGEAHDRHVRVEHPEPYRASYLGPAFGATAEHARQQPALAVGERPEG